MSFYDTCTMLRPKRVKKRPLKLKCEDSDICTKMQPNRVKKRPLKLKGEDSLTFLYDIRTVSEIQYELNEMEDLLQKLRLTLVILEDYVVFMRSGFDLNVAGEPYIAVMLLLDRMSGRFLARIWNRDSICSARQIDSNVSFIFSSNFLFETIVYVIHFLQTVISTKSVTLICQSA